MKIALIGYGKMGKKIEAQALAKGYEISHRIDTVETRHGASLQSAEFSGNEIAIEFTTPEAAVNNIQFLAAKGITTVVGTTGWYNELPRVKEMVAKSGIGFLWSANFSIGVNLFWKMLEKSASLVNQVEDYDVFAHEFHHGQKKDSPSGTAIQTGEILLTNIDRKKEMVTEKLDRAPEKHELHFSSTRGGSVPGTHSVYFDSPFDTIELSHTARSRGGFALGAVLAAEWLADKKGYFEMQDFVNDFFQL